eukprot:TRINITY_DN1188_c0_g1_i1.p2 TRINITY_DN1188_c0_g1~~TRINITY_DN1188_c0_g1_i1.p2  ORF type:complete len:115 (+),score=6.75 TRINITY_DN1188_c0_g1_i1:78-422(+)
MEAAVTLVYGLVVALGGVMGYASKGSLASLIAGGGGTLLMLMGICASNQQRSNKRVSPIWFQISFAVAATLIVAMGSRFMKSNKLMPAGLVAGISLVMCVYYLKVLNGKLKQRA